MTEYVPKSKRGERAREKLLGKDVLRIEVIRVDATKRDILRILDATRDQIKQYKADKFSLNMIVEEKRSDRHE